MADGPYKIVSAKTAEELERQVCIEMLSDWQPQGGIAIDSDTHTFYQVMVPKGD